MATITAPGMFSSGDHASRPAANAVGVGALYACSDHALIYQSDGSSWSIWADLTGTATALGAWTSYTPTWTATSVNPTLGNATLTAKYKELDSKTLALSIYLSFGSTSAAGTGGWSFSLPSGKTAITGRVQILAGHILDNGTAHFVAIGKVNSAATAVSEIIVADSTGTRIAGAGLPVTWATGDTLSLSGIIEIA